EVLRHLEYAEDLAQGHWLRRLTQDPDAAVRFAAMAAAAANRQVDLSERLREMRDGDPSPTVRQWAPYFLQRRAETKTPRGGVRQPAGETPGPPPRRAPRAGAPPPP